MFSPIKPSGTSCRYCQVTVRKIPMPPEAKHQKSPLVLCPHCDRTDLWPTNA